MSTLARPAVLLLCAAAVAQTAAEPRTLAVVAQAFAAQRDALYAGTKQPTRAEEQQLLTRQLDELEAFAAHEAKGEDRWAAQLMIAERAMHLRLKERSRKAVEVLLGDGVPGLARLDAAVFAVQLGDQDARDRLVARALEETTDPVPRLQLARILMTSLRDVAAGEKIVADALAAATDDEQRATVRWYACEATREREDLPENSYYEALEALARDLPRTRWGGIARDRSAASKFAIGAKCFPFSVSTADGKSFESAKLEGRAMALVFARFEDEVTGPLVEAVRALKQTHGAALAVVLVAADERPLAVARAASAIGADTVSTCSGKGLRDDLYLRFLVETVPTVVVVDAAGAIAGLNLHVETRDARTEFDEAFARALPRAK